MRQETLDARNLKCPLPVLKARKAMKPLASGDELLVLVTDPDAPRDFKAYAQTTGHALVSVTAVEGGHEIRLRVA